MILKCQVILKGGKMKKKVILGLSGGVDSSVAIVELLKQGYEVECMFMRNWDSAANNDMLGNPDLNSSVCPQELDYQDALKVAEKLGVKLHRVDFIKEYWDTVFTYFLDEYEKGRTPNPDIMCNKEIKFKAFLKEAKKIGCDYIAMGHYARVKHYQDHSVLLRGVDKNKDQTYFLSGISQEQLRNALFPIGELQKSEVRQIALDYDLATATKKDSTGICFIGERNFNQFLSNYLPAQKGKMVTLDGKVIGEHDGLMYYTIGQRKGLKIGGLDGYDNEPWFVIGKNLAKNELYVGQGFYNPYLMSNRCIVEDMNFFNPVKDEFDCTAKFRYRQEDNNVHVKKLENNLYEITYPQTVRAVTPGQACVLYDGEVCLGGGTIKEVYMDQDKRMY